MARIDPATHLAGQLVQVLDAQRRLGNGAYPLSLRRLIELTDAAAPAELVSKALGKKKLFGQRTVLGRGKDLDAPIAFADDIEQLAGSALLLEFVMAANCTAAAPVIGIEKLKSKVPSKLRQSFDAAVRRAVEENILPATVAAITIKSKKYLHLKRYSLPRAPEVELADKLVKTLHAEQHQGGDRYPITLQRLLEVAGADAGPGVRKKAFRLPAFSEHVVIGIPGSALSPVVLAGDGETLAGSPLLLETVLQHSRQSRGQAFTVAELKKPLATALQRSFEQAVLERVESGALPPGVGSVWRMVRKQVERLLFLTSDLALAPAAPVPNRAVPDRGVAAASGHGDNFATQFDRAFAQLDRRSGNHNLVSLAELRRLVPLDRDAFDHQLQELRRAGRYVLKLAEGRHGLTADEQQAAILEDGRLLLFVARKLS